MSKTAQFVSVRLVVPDITYNPLTGTTNVYPKYVRVGMAQNVRIEDNFGTRPENVIGTAFPIIHPGPMQTTISIEKMTLDHKALSSLGMPNPLLAHVPEAYKPEKRIKMDSFRSEEPEFTQLIRDQGQTFPWIFVLAIKDKIQDSFMGEKDAQGNKLAGPLFGSYACVISSRSVSATSNQATIVESISAYGRPLVGAWMTTQLQEAFGGKKDPNNADYFENGMKNLMNSIMFGYNS